MVDVDVRRIRPDDGERERARELNEAAMRETPEWVPGAPDEDLANVREHYLDADGSEFLVAVVADREDAGDTDIAGRRGETVVATGAYHPLEGWMADEFDAGERGSDGGDATAEVSRMRVDPDRHGEGVGTAVYEELESRARADGYREFVLNTGAENERARGFYESLGFECVRTTLVEFDGLTLDLALYQKSIA